VAMKLYPVVRQRTLSRSLDREQEGTGVLSRFLGRDEMEPQRGTETEEETWNAPHPAAWSEPVQQEAPAPISFLRGRHVVTTIDGRQFDSATSETLPVRLADIIVEVPFQREFKLPRAQRIIDKYDPKIMDPMVVSMRDDGNLYLIRGQHRRYALLELFGPEVVRDCQVWFGLTPEEEAEIFAVEDTIHARLKPAERWVAGLPAKMEPYVSIDALVRGMGWTADPKRRAKYNIRAVGALVRAYQHSGGRSLAATLELFRQLDWADENEPCGEWIEGLAAFLSQHQAELKMSPSQLVDFLRRCGYHSTLDKAEVSVRRYRGLKSAAITTVLEETYNKGRRPENRLMTSDQVKQAKVQARTRVNGKFAPESSPASLL